MGNWLQKILPPTPASRGGSRNLPTTIWQSSKGQGRPPGLPNASIIYGAAAAVLIVFAIYLLIVKHVWIGGLLVFLPAAALLGFALHFLKYPR